MREEALRAGLYLIFSLLLLINLLLCDYIQTKRKMFELHRLRQEKAQLQLVSVEIEKLERRLFNLLETDTRIRRVGNLQEVQKIHSTKVASSERSGEATRQRVEQVSVGPSNDPVKQVPFDPPHATEAHAVDGDFQAQTKDSSVESKAGLL